MKLEVFKVGGEVVVEAPGIFSQAKDIFFRQEIDQEDIGH